MTGRDEGQARRGPLTGRVLLLALVLIPLNAWWLTETEYVRYTDNVTTQALFFNAVSLLLVLVGVNRLLGAARPAWRFAPPEMVALYVIVVAASGLAGHDTLQILFTTLTFPFRNAQTNADWNNTILPHLPPHLVVRDPTVINALYSGNSTLYRWENARPWLGPLGWWTLFVLLLVWTMFCLATLFRKQWEAERLSYPIAELPVQILTEERTLFRNRLLWAGFAVGAACQVINLVHALYPSVPAVPTGVQYFRTDRFPWNAAGPLPLAAFPFAFGLTFLLPTQLGFSTWFFFLVSRVELVGAAMAGYTEWGKFPYISQQGVGAIFGFFLAVVWTARGHLARVWAAALGGRETDDADEALSYRTTVFGLLAGVLGLAWFAVAAGMRWQTAFWYLGLFLVIVVVVARLRAELGLPTFELYQFGADHILHTVAGTNAWTRGDLTVMSLFFFLGRTHRQFPMQTHVDALHLGRRTNTPLRSLAVVLLLASALGTLAAFWAYLHVVYQTGFQSGKFAGPAVWAFGRAPWQKMETWISSPTRPDPGAIRAYLFGAGFVLSLSALRARFVWWPFHPAGYLVSGSFGLFRLWFPIFLSWLIKVLLLRYGGLRAYRAALPFFLGLILGEFGMGFLRSLLDFAFGLYLPPESGIGGL
jgi:hypothetical protein